MEKKSRDGVAGRFAENLVGQMLQRSGAVFFKAQAARADARVDFVVMRNEKSYPVAVKYVDDASQAGAIWKEWSEAGRKRKTGKSVKPIPRQADGGDGPVHLIVVAGSGDKVFTDTTIAPMLAADNRTNLSVLD